MINRRKFLKNSAVGLGAASGLASNFATMNAFAQSGADDYKALVCVYLAGGMDGHDTLIPTDTRSSRQYEGIRERLLSRYDRRPDGFSRRRRSNLLSLQGADVDGRTFGFPEELRPLQQLFNQGHMSIVGNVGPLVEPLNSQQFRNGSRRVPPRLASHNDMTSTWMASSPEGAGSGWGGRFSDFMSGANTNSSFTSVSAAGRRIFLTGEQTQAFQVDSSGGLNVTHLDSDNVLGSSVFADNYNAILVDSSRRTRRDETLSLFGRDTADIMRNAINDNALLTRELARGNDSRVNFPNSNLGQQLEIVSRMIARRSRLGAGRQVFFVELNGFDTHRNQAETLPALQQDLANSVRAFYDSTVDLGVSENVTTFTASDFGRTLQVSGSGTDHGWGNHHMVIGGAVRGGQILGEVPPPILGHAFDQGRGRMIPQVSVDQYAGALGRWYGLSRRQVRQALPGIVNFDQRALNGLFI